MILRLGQIKSQIVLEEDKSTNQIKKNLSTNKTQKLSIIKQIIIK